MSQMCAWLGLLAVVLRGIKKVRDSAKSHQISPVFSRKSHERDRVRSRKRSHYQDMYTRSHETSADIYLAHITANTQSQSSSRDEALQLLLLRPYRRSYLKSLFSPANAPLAKRRPDRLS